MLASLLAPPALAVATSAVAGGAMLFTALSLFDLRTPSSWRPSRARAAADADDGRSGPPLAPPDDPTTLSGRWIGIQLFGPGAHDYFAWTLSLTQRGTSLDGEVHLRMATTAGLVGTAGRVLVRGTVVGDTVTMRLVTARARRGPGMPYRLTLGAGRRAMVGTTQVTSEAPGYLISLVRR